MKEMNAVRLEAIVKQNPQIHRVTDGIQVMKELRDQGIHAHLVGSVGMGFPSAHDIDVLVVRENLYPGDDVLLRVFSPECFARTGHGSIYMHKTKLGLDVEVFFE